jgi:hypothetical protein
MPKHPSTSLESKAMSLSENQQRYVDGLQAVFSAFKLALVQALNADNNRETHLDTASEKRKALTNAAAGLQRALGANYSAYAAVVSLQPDGTWGSTTGPSNGGENLSPLTGPPVQFSSVPGELLVPRLSL